MEKDAKSRTAACMRVCIWLVCGVFRHHEPLSSKTVLTSVFDECPCRVLTQESHQGRFHSQFPRNLGKNKSNTYYKFNFARFLELITSYEIFFPGHDKINS